MGNNIYNHNPGEKKQSVYVVVCEENWVEVVRGSEENVGEIPRHAWISWAASCNISWELVPLR